MRSPRALAAPVVLLLALTAGEPASAQQRMPLLADLQQSPAPPEVGPAAALTRTQVTGVAGLAAAGTAAAVAGSFAGLWAGYHLDRNVFGWDGGDDPGIVGALGGWFLGSAIATPLAVHLANDRRGSLGSAYLASGLIAGAGLAGLYAIGSPGGIVFIVGAPVVQVISAVASERRASR